MRLARWGLFVLDIALVASQASLATLRFTEGDMSLSAVHALLTVFAGLLLAFLVHLNEEEALLFMEVRAVTAELGLDYYRAQYDRLRTEKEKKN